MDRCVTLRSYLMGNLNDLVESVSLGDLGKSSLVCEVVSLFVDYQEEGASLFLDAFFTDGIDKLTALIPQSTCLKIGSVPCNESGIRKAVKKTAPLVRGSWKMYFAPCPAGLDFGLFRDSGNPLNVPIDLMLQDGGAGDAKFIRITRLDRDSVRVSAHDGKYIIVNFTNERDELSDSGHSLQTLCEVVCSGIVGNVAQTCKTYLSSILTKAIRESHGSLIAVVGTSKNIPKFLNDCTLIDPPLDLVDVVESSLGDASMIPELYANESIVLGMFSCDGIVVFNTKAKILAYNAFIKLRTSDTAGGARRRAYQALCDKVDKKRLKAAFFHSQDGTSEIRRRER